MEINDIQKFVVLAETRNFMEAAERLFISQSTLSKHIKDIESEFGIPLFNRTTRKVELSEFGEMFLPYANQIIHLYNEYTSALFHRLENSKTTLTLGCIPSLAPYNITEVLAEFKKENMGFTLNVIQDESDKLEDMLRQNRCELAFIRQVDNRSGEFIEIPYAVDSLAAIFPVKHPLAKCDSILFIQLKGEEFLLLPKHSRPYNLCKRICEENGFEPNVVFTDHQIENIIDLVGKGMGVALLMKKLVIHLMNQNISIVDILPSINTHISLCYKKDAKLSEGAKHFLDYFNLKFVLKNNIPSTYE